MIPHYIIKTSRKWYKNTVTGKYIPAIAIKSYVERLNQPKPKEENILAKRWDLTSEKD